MRRAGVLAILPTVAILLFVSAAAAEPTLPPDLRVIADDDYVERVPVGSNVSFVWSIVNLGGGAAATYNLTVTGNLTSPDYGLEVTPLEALLRAGELVTIYANVTVPLDPAAPEAELEVRVQEQGGDLAILRATVVAESGPEFVDLLTAFVAIGAIIFIGFLASLFFERTKVPDLIWLILLGLVLGPILVTFFGISLIPARLIRLATPYFAALALMIILFDGGLNLNIRKVVSRAGVSILHTMVGWVGTIFVVTFIAMSFLGYPFWVGVLLGAILGGTSGAIVIGVVRGMTISEDTQTILILEATITDVLCIIGALTVIGILQGGGTLTGTIGDIVSAFAVALLLGFLAGVLWLRVLSALQGKPFGFMTTIAALFILYAGAEFLGGSGGMAALIFGLVLGNHEEVGRVLRIKEAFRVDRAFKQFDSEISFVVRTFFFVFLGFSFTLPFAAAWAVRTDLPIASLLNDTFWLLLLAIVATFLGIVAVRAGTSAITAAIHKESRQDRGAMMWVMGRGLAAAVLASLPFAVAPFTNPANPDYSVYHTTMAPYEAQFLTVAFLIILLTVVATSVGVVASERRRRPSEFSAAATDVLGREMVRQLQETRRELVREERREARLRRKEWKRAERELRRRRKG